MGLPSYADKFRGCMAPSQAYSLLVPVGFLIALALFATYLPSWGENQIREALNLSSDVDIGDLNASYIGDNSCSGCVFGSNTQWPTNTTGARHFLDSNAGATASGVVATSLAVAAAISTGTMLWVSAMPSAAAFSFSGGFYEMMHMVEQAQFVGMISHLRLEGAPTFLLEFSKELSWTNFNLAKSSSYSESGGVDRRLADSSSSRDSDDESGPARYAALIGEDADGLFFYTLITFAVVLAVIHVLYIILVLVTGILAKNESLKDVARRWYRRVIWASVLALLLAQYMFSMAGSYFLSSGSTGRSTPRYVLGSAALTAVVLFALGLGLVVVANNKDELKDVGTSEHKQRAFSSKYSIYYDGYDFKNRFFFVPRILLAVLTGIIVGVVNDATFQLQCILGITLAYLILLLVRRPNLLRLRHYMDSVSVFMKVVITSIMLIVTKDDSYPQSVRDNVAYGIIAMNMLFVFLLFACQGYAIIYKIIVACNHNQNRKGSSSSDTMEIVSLELGTNTPLSRDYQQVESTPAGRSPDWNVRTPRQVNQQQQLTTQTSRDNLDNMPILEVPDEKEVVPTLDPPRTRDTRNQQYPPRRSSRATDTNTTSQAPVPEVPASARHLPLPVSTRESTRTKNETARQTLSRESSARIPVQPRPSSRPSTVPLTASLGFNFAGGVGHRFSKKKNTLHVNDLHDSDISLEEDFVAEPPVPAPARQQFAHGPSPARPHFNPGGTLRFAPGDSTTSTNAGMENSYCNFEDSGISTTSTSINFSDSSISTSTYDFSDSTITTDSEILGQSTVKTDNTFSAAMEAIPGSSRSGYGGDFDGNSSRKTSISSNESGSFDGNSSRWFKKRSKTIISVNESEASAAYEPEDTGYDGPTIASAFSRRQSQDSYGYQSTVNYASSTVDFNAESHVSNNRLDQTLELKPSFDGYASMGADSLDEYPSQRRTGTSNHSFISDSSDGSDFFMESEKSDKPPNVDRYSHYNNFTL